jgi:hypothetical protein
MLEPVAAALFFAIPALTALGLAAAAGSALIYCCCSCIHGSVDGHIQCTDVPPFDL